MLHLVAGGAGFLGGHLTNALIDDGERVVIMDDLSGGSIRNLEHAISSGIGTFIYVDVTEADAALSDLVARAKCGRVDRVYHLAHSAAHDPAATIPLIDLALVHQARLLFVTGPDRGDAAGNTAVRRHVALLRACGRDARLLHLPECYGPGMDERSGGLVAGLFRAAESRLALPLEEPPSRRHALMYVGDAVALLRRAMEAPSLEHAPLACYEDYAVAEIARAVARVTGVIASTSTSPLDGNLRATYRWLREERLAFA
jgi:nucleoside-diphosphate-sugar epimerase